MREKGRASSDGLDLRFSNSEITVFQPASHSFCDALCLVDPAPHSGQHLEPLSCLRQGGLVCSE